MSERIPRGGFLPAYKKLSQEIAASIENGRFHPGEKLPTEEALLCTTGLSKGTIRSAYAELAQKGFVVKRQGSGTFVADDIAQARKRCLEGMLAALFDGCMESGMTAAQAYASIADVCTAIAQPRKTSVGLIDCTPEILSDAKRQLEKETGFAVSAYLLDDVLGKRIELLPEHDFLITTSRHYHELLGFSAKKQIPLETVELSVSAKTLMQLAKIGEDSMVGILYQSGNFLTNIRPVLASLGKNNPCLPLPMREWEEQRANLEGMDVAYLLPPEMENDGGVTAKITAALKSMGAQAVQVEYRIDEGSLLRLKDMEGMRDA